MNELQTFKNELFEVAVKLENGEIVFDAEHVAKCLGFTTVAKSGNVTVRWSRVNEYLSKYISQDIAKGDLIPESLVYKLAFKASNEVAEQFQDWLAIKVIPSIRKTGGYSHSISSAKDSFEMHLLGMEYSARILRCDQTSKIKMLEVVHKEHGVSTKHLPAYVDEEVTQSLSQLRKEHDIKLSSAKINTKLIEFGILEIKERPSSKGGMKEFKSLTEKGIAYGKNLISPNNPKETQPHYYPSKFLNLMELLKMEVTI